MLKVSNLTLRKNKKIILDRVSCEFPTGTITVLLGKSGSGKSTLLRCLAGLEPKYEGIITGKQKEVGMIFQSYALFPHLTSLQNCVQPLQVVYKMTKTESYDRAMQALSKLGIDGYANSYPHELSGGQQQRVACARAIATNASIFLFDEPTSALDPENAEVLAHVTQTLRDDGKTICISTHDIAFAQKVMQRLYILEAGKIATSQIY